ncbi:MAG: GNAT family N-acetyltransferase [Chloroflexota bacterium]
MNYKIIPLSHLNGEQVEGLARLHHRVMHSLLTDLGLPFVERYYRIAGRDSSVVGMCAVDNDGNLLGWAAGSPKPNQVNRRMRDAWMWFIIQMLRVSLTRPKLIRQLVASARSSSAEMKAGAIELTYLGVDASARKQGLGRALLNAFLEAARAKKFSTVELSVEADNAGAIALYTKAGFAIIASFKEGAFDRHRMELKLG